MNKNVKLSLVAAAIIGTSAITGCSSDGTIDNLVKSISGTANAAYNVGATVFADCNKNGILDAGELSTLSDSKGKFTLTPSTGEVCGGQLYTIVAINGKNSDTNATVPFSAAPGGFKVISPVTTLLKDLNSSQIDTFAGKLGLTADDLKFIDYNEVGETNATQAKVAKLASFKIFVETALASLGGTAQSASKEAIDSIVEAVNELDLTQDLNTTVVDSLTAKVKEKAAVNGIDAAVLTSFETNVNTVKLTVQAIADLKTTDTNASALQEAIKSAEETAETIIAAATATLSITNGSVTILGDKTTTVDKGTFSTVSIKPSELTLDTNASLFDISFPLTSKFDANVTKAITIAVSIDDQGSSKALTSYVSGVFKTDANKNPSITIPKDAYIIANGVRSNGSAISEVAIQNEVENSFTAVNGTIDVNLKSIFDRLNTAVSADLVALAQNMTTYDVKAVVQGVSLDSNQTVAGAITSGSRTITGAAISGIVAVTENKAPSVSVDPSFLTVTAGETNTSTITANDEDGTIKSVTAVSSDETVATVTENDTTVTVKGVKAGQANITVTATDDKGLANSTNLTVDVVAVPEVNVAPTAPTNLVLDPTSVEAGKTVSVSWTASTDANNDAITYDVRVMDTNDATVGTPSTGITGTSTTITAPSTAGTYKIEVGAKDSKGLESTSGAVGNLEVTEVQTVVLPTNATLLTIDDSGFLTTVANGSTTTAAITVDASAGFNTAGYKFYVNDFKAPATPGLNANDGICFTATAEPTVQASSTDCALHFTFTQDFTTGTIFSVDFLNGNIKNYTY